MRAFAPRTLIVLLCLSCLPVFSQEARVVRIGVALLSSRTDTVPAARARDELAEALNDHKVNPKQNIALRAVGLNAPAGSRAIAEGKHQKCEFVLYTRVQSVEKASKNGTNAEGSLPLAEVDTAWVGYELRRASDGAPYALGIVRSQESDSVAEAILDAIGNIPNKVVADLKNPNNAAEIARAALARPRLDRDEFQGDRFCDWLPKDLPHAAALRGVCNYAAIRPEKIPNFVCQQETSRYIGHARVPADLITATIRYVDGEESYRDLHRNGKPVLGAMWRTAGVWSSGQFEGDLRNIFDAGNQAMFVYAGEKKIGDHTAWVFTYQIARQYEPLWELRAEDQVAAPPYDGELWIDAVNGRLMHFRSTAQDLAAQFPIRSAEVLSDFDSVAFPDGTDFLLPLRSTVATRYREEALTRNVVELRGCHKFRATARMLLDAPGSAGPETSAAPSDAELAAELEENEEIYAILREQAVAEDATRFAIEQQQELKSTTGEAFWKMARLEKQREKVVASRAKSAPTETKYELDTSSDGGARLKVYVRLVPVSIVVRDSKGRAVGNLRKEDFQLFDNRKPQEIMRFSMEKADDVQVAKATSDVAGKAAAATTNNVAYVFDDLHTTSADLARAKAAAERHLSWLAARDRAAVFSTSGNVVLDFTGDHEKISAALHRLKSHTKASPVDCPPLSYYVADAIVNQGDSSAMELAMEDAMDCTFPGSGVRSQQGGGARFEQQMELEKARRIVLATAVEVAEMGRMESDQTLGMLHDVLGRTAAMPGRRTVLLLSPGFLALTPEQQRGAMNLIQRALDAGVIISSLDVRGLAAVNLASNRSHVNQPAESQVLTGQEGFARCGLLADFAYGTGGTYFHDNGDLDEAFRRAAELPEYVYVLGFSPQRLDGKFHKLKITVSGPSKRNVQARSGYYALKPSSAH